jgi:hypothetical protein
VPHSAEARRNRQERAPDLAQDDHRPHRAPAPAENGRALPNHILEPAGPCRTRPTHAPGSPPHPLGPASHTQTMQRHLQTSAVARRRAHRTLPTVAEVDRGQSKRAPHPAEAGKQTRTHAPGSAELCRIRPNSASAHRNLTAPAEVRRRTRRTYLQATETCWSRSARRYCGTSVGSAKLDRAMCQNRLTPTEFC